MFNELDVVKLKRKLNELLPEGTMGVVHQIYPGSLNWYLVEFLDEESNTISICDVTEDDIELGG